MSRIPPSRRTTTDKGKPGVSRGRKATGLGAGHLIQLAGLPNGAASGRSLPGPARGRKIVRLKANFVHGIQAVAEGGLLAVVFVGLMVGAASASNGAGPDKSSSSISLVVLGTGSLTTSATAEPQYGDRVTFNISTTATTYPYVNLKCYQNGALVAQGWAGFFDGALGTQAFGLYSPQWTGGAADCVANLDMNSHGKWKVLASTSFHVGA
jgi:hypothetical protein